MAWYDKGQLLSYRKLFNVVIGPRGLGKSYGFKKWALDDFINNGNQFVWVRRYSTELEKIKKEKNPIFFDDIIDQYPKHKLEIKGNKNGGQFYVDGNIAGYYLALSVSTSFKSMPFPKVNKIIFDEFLIDKTTYHYLPNEIIILLDLMETVFRKRDNIRGMFLIGNNISFANPYFLFFKVKPFKSRFYVNGDLCIEMYKDEEFAQEKLNTRFGQFVSQFAEEYKEYSIDNKPLLDNDSFIAVKPEYAVFRCAIRYKGKIYGFWLDWNQGTFYANDKYDPYSPETYSLTRDDHEINTFLIKKQKNTYLDQVIWAFRNGSLFFDNVMTKNQVYEVLSFFIR